MILYVAVLGCAIVLAWMVYRYDLYDKEPWYLLILAVVLAYGLSLANAHVEDYVNILLGFYEPGRGHIAGQAAVASILEGLVHISVVVLIAVWFRAQFNDPIDGLIYGAFAGIGMALAESFDQLWLSQRTGPVDAYVQRLGPEFVRLVLHLVIGGIGGFGVGLVVEHSRLRFWPTVLAGFLATAMILHFLWDYCCGIPMLDAGPALSSQGMIRTIALVLMFINIGVFAGSVVLGSRLSRGRFAPASKKRLWRWPLFR